MMSHSLTGTFQPDELNSLKSVYNDISTQRWFTKTDEAREGFARYLLTTFPGDTLDPSRDRAAIELSARSFCAANNN